MKKQYLALVISLGLVLSACGSSSSAQSADTAETAVQESSAVSETAAEEPKTQAETAETPPEQTDAEVITEGRTVAIDDVCEFTLDFISITKDVMPPHPGSWYGHYEAEAGKVYVDVCVAYKNLESSDIRADKVLGGKLIYNNNYEFNGFSVIEEDSRSDFTYSNITSISPLSTEYLHYLFEVPEEVGNNGPIDVILTVAGSDYKIAVKEGTGEPEAAEEKELGKTSGEIVQGEEIVTSNAEFSIDYSAVTKDVMPPHPGSWYSHYEAENGKVYVDICVAYKNTSGQSIRADKVLSAKLKYADKYDYTGFSTIEEDSRSDFTYTNITSIAPLSTEYVHYLFEVPDEVADSGESIVISLTVDGNTYTYNMR